ncbi:MAG: glycoside hydrolase family 78 protein [Roseburia sp.]|nr:glycoside hydrolase family 78 protein [Roseburia sp.]MCM1098583.1 glycoside hydrolase family 78 protein [Ruminococcus flavefaciens]
MRLYDLKVNHLRNPLGFRMERCVFSWKAAEAKGKQQEAARIRVAADPELQEILFDSGFDSQASSLAYRAEVALRPRTRYYWDVTVRTDAGEEASGEVQWFETGKREEPWTGRWISCQPLETSPSDEAKGVVSEKRHPWFEKEIAPEGQVAQARLYLCGLGLYEAYYTRKGGEAERIGKEYLTPYSNDYKEWVQYQTFDVTGLLQEGGTLSVLLGNGWYKARFGFTAVEDIGFYGDQWKLIAELHLTYADGRTQVIGTDKTWKVRRSNITFSNLYDGEWQDDTLEPLPVTEAVLCPAPEGKLTDRMSLPVTVQETFRPAKLLKTPAGESVFDMGQEFTGIFALRVHEPAGTVIHIQTGEILQQGNFYNANLRSAKSEYYYISDGKEKLLIPHFTFYGYRYVKIEGVSDLKPEDFTGWAYYSEIEEKGRLRTGHELVNRFIENVRWGLQGNFVDVPTDCPQRDERMGWTGDAQVFSPTATYLKDTYAFYAKYLYDMAREQSALGGKVPDVVPSCGVESCACVWGDASCIIPWNLYLFYGDRSILEDQFESMRSWVDYITEVDGDYHGWRYVFHYGDWLALDNPKGGAEQTLGATDEEFIANIYYAASAGIVAKAAAVLGRREEEEKYKKLSEEQFEIVKREYYSATGRCCIKTQTAMILTLKYRLSENIELTKAQLKKLFEENNNKLQTGFVGTPLLCNVLTENGFDKLAYELLLNEEYPGWLNEVKLGATTVWERWNSLLSDGTISGIGMNSMNHYSYGSVEEWMFRHSAGINSVDEAPGFTRVSFEPLLNWELRSMEAEYDSPSGLYKSAWRLTDPSHVELSVTVPFGCSATLRLPHAKAETFTDKGNPMFADVREGICYLEPGTYSVSYETDEPLKRSYSTRTPLRELLGNKKLAEKLSRMIPLDQIPEQYKGLSMRELAEKFGGRMNEEQLDGLDRMLAAF